MEKGVFKADPSRFSRHVVTMIVSCNRSTSCLYLIFFILNLGHCHFQDWSLAEDDSEFFPSSSILEDWSELMEMPDFKERDGGKVMKKPDRIVNKKPNNKTQDITETDLFLLGAIEKLAYRMDFLEKRLQRTEEMIYHIYSGNKYEETEPCPNGFQRQQGICYHFSSKQLNWKSSSSMCRSMGGILLEFNSDDERTRLVSFLQSDLSLKDSYWTGGLNPGLLWLWGSSAKPVPTSNSTANAVHGDGRCLLLELKKNRNYGYLGTDCSERHRYICLAEDNSVRNRLGRLLKQRQKINP